MRAKCLKLLILTATVTVTLGNIAMAQAATPSPSPSAAPSATPVPKPGIITLDEFKAQLVASCPCTTEATFFARGRCVGQLSRLKSDLWQLDFFGITGTADRKALVEAVIAQKALCKAGFKKNHHGDEDNNQNNDIPATSPTPGFEGDGHGHNKHGH